MIPSPPRSADLIDEGSMRPSITWIGWFTAIWQTLNPGISTTVVLGKLTTGGSNGSLTVKKGIITAYSAPT